MRYGIIGCGGGYTGVYSVGALEAIVESGLRPTIVRGYSVNALNLALVVQYGWDARPLKKVWLDIEQKGPHFVFDFRKWQMLKGTILRRPHILKNDGIKYLSDQLDTKKIIEYSPFIEYQVAVLNEENGRQEVFSTRDNGIAGIKVVKDPELLRSLIFASTSFPLFPPVLIDNTPYCDAVITDIVLDAKSLFDQGCEKVFVLINSSDSYVKPKQAWWLSRLLNIVYRQTNNELEDAKFIYGDKLIVFRPNQIIKSVSRYSFKKRDISRGLVWSHEDSKIVLENI